MNHKAKECFCSRVVTMKLVGAVSPSPRQSGPDQPGGRHHPGPGHQRVPAGAGYPPRDLCVWERQGGTGTSSHTTSCCSRTATASDRAARQPLIGGLFICPAGRLLLQSAVWQKNCVCGRQTEAGVRGWTKQTPPAGSERGMTVSLRSTRRKRL